MIFVKLILIVGLSSFTIYEIIKSIKFFKTLKKKKEPNMEIGDND